MVMTRYGGSDRRRLVKGSSSSEGKTFDQEGSTIDPIDVEPLSLAPLASVMPYGTSENEIPAKEGCGEKESYPLENQNIKSSNLRDNPVQKPIEIVSKDIEIEANPFGLRENSPIKKLCSQDPNPNESGVQTYTEPLRSEKKEEQPMPLQWTG